MLLLLWRHPEAISVVLLINQLKSQAENTGGLACSVTLSLAQHGPAWNTLETHVRHFHHV